MEVYGRNAEFAAITAAHAERRAAVLSGPPGIGKSAMAAAIRTPKRVLCCAPFPTDQAIEYRALAELLGPLDSGALPEEQRAAVDAVLRRGGREVDPLALHLGVRALFTAEPTLVIIDGANWVDQPSAELLAPALSCVDVLLTEQTDAQRSPLGYLRRTVIKLGPLDVVALGELLPGLDPYVLHAESGGNPGYAKLLASGADLLDTVPAELHATLLHIALASNPTAELLARAGCTGLHRAAALGLIELGETVRFTVGALPALLAELPGQRAAHARMAAAHRDPLQRLRHHALAEPDADCAEELAAAALTTRAKGDRALAAELYELSARRTENAELAVARWLECAHDAAAAKDPARAARAERAVLHGTADPAPRVAAGLATIDAAGQELDRLDEKFAGILFEAGDDPALLAEVHFRLAVRTNLAGRPAAAVEHCARAAACATDGHTELLALTMQARMQRVLGDPRAAQTLLRALALPEQSVPLNYGPRQLRARFALFDDELDDCRPQLFALLAEAEHDGGSEVIVDVLRSIAELELKAGDCAAALATANRALRISEQACLTPGPALYTCALAEIAGGTLDSAQRHAHRGVLVSAADHDQVYLSRNRFALGIAAMQRGDIATALVELRAVRAGESSVDPSMLCWQTELAETLARSGKLAEAEELLTLTGREHRAGVLARLDRATACLRFAREEHAAAAELLDSAAHIFAELRLPIEQARTLLIAGRVQRRMRRNSRAHELFCHAAEIFTQCAARPWLSIVEHEFTGSAELTPAEYEVATLAVAGATNRDIAARLFISVKTVEAMLTRSYRKLGIRSRAQLSAHL